MQNDRFRIVAEPEYLERLGRAMYAFSELEWMIVNCCEKLGKGYISTIRKKTAEQIANDFLARAKQIDDEKLRGECVSHAQNCKGLVQLRNDIVHVNPGTTRPCLSG